MTEKRDFPNRLRSPKRFLREEKQVKEGEKGSSISKKVRKDKRKCILYLTLYLALIMV